MKPLLLRYLAVLDNLASRRTSDQRYLQIIRVFAVSLIGVPLSIIALLSPAAHIELPNLPLLLLALSSAFAGGILVLFVTHEAYHDSKQDNQAHATRAKLALLSLIDQDQGRSD